MPRSPSKETGSRLPSMRGRFSCSIPSRHDACGFSPARKNPTRSATDSTGRSSSPASLRSRVMGSSPARETARGNRRSQSRGCSRRAHGTVSHGPSVLPARNGPTRVTSPLLLALTSATVRPRSSSNCTARMCLSSRRGSPTVMRRWERPCSPRTACSTSTASATSSRRRRASLHACSRAAACSASRSASASPRSRRRSHSELETAGREAEGAGGAIARERCTLAEPLPGPGGGDVRAPRPPEPAGGSRGRPAGSRGPCGNLLASQPRPRRWRRPGAAQDSRTGRPSGRGSTRAGRWRGP